jgi:DNA-binding NarL/FixJ family response regulator
MTDLGFVSRPQNARLAGLRVAIVEDHALVAQSLQLAFRAEGADVFPIVLTDPASMVADCQMRQPNVLLLDLDLGELGDGSRLIEPFSSAGARVVLLTGSDDVARLGACVEAGAVGIIAKTEDLDVVIEQVGRAARGERVMSAQRRFDLLIESRQLRFDRESQLAPFAALTVREAQVLAEMMHGYQTDKIGHRLFVSEATVRTHVRAVLQKLGVRSQLAAVARARDAGWRPELGASSGSPRLPCQRSDAVHYTTDSWTS